MDSNPKSKIQNLKSELTRRTLLQGTSMGLGSLALGWLLGQEARGEASATGRRAVAARSVRLQADAAKV
jgi:hypothetical protein